MSESAMLSFPISDSDVDAILPLVASDSEGNVSTVVLPPTPPNRNVKNLVAQVRVRGIDFHCESQSRLSSLLQELLALEVMYDALIARRARIKADIAKEEFKIGVSTAVLKFIDEKDAGI